MVVVYFEVLINPLCIFKNSLLIFFSPTSVVRILFSYGYSIDIDDFESTTWLFLAGIW
jgi:hypothetical protein